jgi:hypothetical protein
VGKYLWAAVVALCYRNGMTVRAMLWFGRDCMLVFLELFDDISRHQNIQSMVVVIPIQLDATVEVAIPIFSEFVLF